MKEEQVEKLRMMMKTKKKVKKFKEKSCRKRLLLLAAIQMILNIIFFHPALNFAPKYF